MAKRNDSPDPERNLAVNSATDAYPPGTTAAQTSVPTDTAKATHEPGPAKGPEDRGGDSRGGVE